MNTSVLWRFDVPNFVKPPCIPENAPWHVGSCGIMWDDQFFSFHLTGLAPFTCYIPWCAMWLSHGVIATSLARTESMRRSLCDNVVSIVHQGLCKFVVTAVQERYWCLGRPTAAAAPTELALFFCTKRGVVSGTQANGHHKRPPTCIVGRARRSATGERTLSAWRDAAADFLSALPSWSNASRFWRSCWAGRSPTTG